MESKKYIIYNFLALGLLLAITIILIIKESNKSQGEIASVNKVTDDCIYEAQEIEEEVATSSAEQKLSPNAELVIQKYYTACGHSVDEHAEILPEMVNKNQEEIENEFSELDITAFDSNELVVKKEQKGYCGEHYILREVNGKVVVNWVDENNKEDLFEETSIPTQYLTQTDLINLKDGIRIYGRKNLNSMLEDYE